MTFDTPSISVFLFILLVISGVSTLKSQGWSALFGFIVTFLIGAGIVTLFYYEYQELSNFLKLSMFFGSAVLLVSIFIDRIDFWDTMSRIERIQIIVTVAACCITIFATICIK